MNGQNTLSKLIVTLTAVVFVVYGIGFVLFPVEILQTITGHSVAVPAGITDIRATYGGMSIGVGIILYLLVREAGTIRLALVSVVVIMITMAAGRSYGMLVDGEPTVFMYLYLALEIIVSAVGLVLLYRLNGRFAHE